MILVTVYRTDDFRRISRSSNIRGSNEKFSFTSDKKAAGSSDGQKIGTPHVSLLESDVNWSESANGLILHRLDNW